MIPLTARGEALRVASPLVCKVVRDPNLDSQWFPRVLLAEVAPTREQRSSVSAIICNGKLTPEDLSQLDNLPVVHGLSASHLQQGDVVSISPEGVVRTLFRRGSPHNTLFATERCNSFCVMCSQPPREVDDGWRVDEM